MRRVAPQPRRAGFVGVFLLLVVAVGAESSCNLVVNLNDVQGGCPPAKHGASQVKVTTGSKPFCIDTTEATNAQYLQFKESGFVLAAAQVPDGCQTLGDPSPSQNWPYGPGYEDYPVDFVNWCQAYSFCAWAGKRLCGQIGGKAISVQNEEDPTLSQWVNACSQGGKRVYPYGNTFNQTTCGGGGGANNSQREIVTQSSACVGGVAGLLDMSGNLWEWNDACDAPTPTNPAVGVQCHALGGAYDSTPTDLECTSGGQPRAWSRNSSAANIGFRCCLDL
jgi:formylglycine-generating enzyme required for sulfatase activity